MIVHEITCDLDEDCMCSAGIQEAFKYEVFDLWCKIEALRLFRLEVEQLLEETT